MAVEAARDAVRGGVAVDALLFATLSPAYAEKLDTATIQANVDSGTYEVRAGSSQAVAQEIQPAELDVGESRGDSNDQLLQP